MAMRVAVDIGGTFTDVVGFDDDRGGITVEKVLSTPRDLVDGILAGLDGAGIALADPSSVIHGSTIVINALIERHGARTAILTTRGFRDVYHIGRINRPDAFNLHFEQHRPLVEREHVHEVDERMRGNGTVHRPLDEDAARETARALHEQGVEAIAVVLLNSYRNPAHELRLGEILAEECPTAFISLSHELTREYREFERTSTTAANAFVGPIVDDYLSRIEKSLAQGGNTGSFAVMQSNGGLSSIESARRQPVQMMESGPSGGVVGTIELCRSLGYRDAIAFDMGGTTAKAAVIRDLAFPQAAEYFVGGYVRGLPIRIPCLDIVEVGTGGGSIAWHDGAGGLHVGPRSAGAEPGPACYGQGGTDATVTDAAVVLNILSGEKPLSGGLTLDVARARETLAEVGAPVGLDPEHAAGGVLAIAATSMANAVRAVTTQRGLDPRAFALVAYGGNGPVHISLVARELGINDVVIPPVPAVFSALGMLMADLRYDVVLTDIRRLDDRATEGLERDLSELERSAREVIDSSNVGHGDVHFLRAVDMRYVGQEHALAVDVPDLTGAGGTARLKAAFDLAHLARFGHSAAEEPAEIVSMRVSAVGTTPHPDLPTIGSGDATPPDHARLGQRSVVFDHVAPAVPTPVYDRAGLLAGNRITGPAAIEEPTTTTLLRPGDSLLVDRTGSLLITIGETR